MSEETNKESKEKNKSFNIFIANSIYPNAEEIFTAKFKSLEEIKNDCIVIVDTNALLIPYTVNKEGLEQIKKTYLLLSNEKRLIIPGQVAREFAKNRANKISELYTKLEQKRNGVSNFETGKYPLLDSIKKYKEVLELEKKINELIKRYRDSIGETLEGIRNWTWNDPVSLLYGEVFKGIVLDIKINEDEVKKELSDRQIHKIPPGYKDASKPDEGIGDYLIWKTILEVGKAQKKSVLFVSGEEKPDWWHRGNNTLLYPRYELLVEFRQVSDSQTFHITTFSNFLDLYGASDKVVAEVRSKEIHTVPSNRIGSFGGFISINHEKYVKNAVAIWLADNFSDISINESERDYLNIIHSNSFQTQVKIIHLGKQKHIMDTLFRLDYFAQEQAKSSIEGVDYTIPLLILVSQTDTLAIQLADNFQKNYHSLPNNCSIIIGYITGLGQFINVYSSENIFTIPN